MTEKDSLGSLVFSREYLVVPISDDATIFPYDILMRSTIGMETIDLVENIDSYPIKLRKVVVGCDFAKSANVGADYTVYSVWGVDTMDNYYLLVITSYSIHYTKLYEQHYLSLVILIKCIIYY